MDHWGRGAARVLSFLCPAVYLWAGTGQAGTSEGVEGVAGTDKDAGADASPTDNSLLPPPGGGLHPRHPSLDPARPGPGPLQRHHPSLSPQLGDRAGCGTRGDTTNLLQPMAGRGEDWPFQGRGQGSSVPLSTRRGHGTSLL